MLTIPTTHSPPMKDTGTTHTSEVKSTGDAARAAPATVDETTSTTSELDAAA